MATGPDPVRTGIVAGLAKAHGAALKTAKTLGLTIPPLVRERADALIE